ncbi:MAG: hypothetical protein DMF83_06120 [Acidobacteria bacterium]|nr:MAG: hypothetical protein DMF83_06120 [Acidobacteriota bacterium]
MPQQGRTAKTLVSRPAAAATASACGRVANGLKTNRVPSGASNTAPSIRESPAEMVTTKKRAPATFHEAPRLSSALYVA